MQAYGAVASMLAFREYKPEIVRRIIIVSGIF